MSQLTLVVQIPVEELPTLQEANYSLCLSRNIILNNTEQAGNVVFSSVAPNELAENITFNWCEDYQVSESTTFRVFNQSFIFTSISD
jgi:hypothetical protein